MSEESQVETTTEASAETTAESAENTAAPTESKAEAPAAPAFEYPKKFLKDDGTLDAERMAKSYMGLEKRLSSKPNMPAASVDEYEWTPPEDFKIELDPERVSEFKTTLLEQGFTKAQYGYIMGHYANLMNEIGAQAMTPEKRDAALKESWGNDFDANKAAALAAFEAYAPSDVSIEDPVLQHPTVLKLLASFGRELSEDSLTPVSKGAAATGGTTEAEIAEIMKSKEYRDGDKALHAKVTAWYQAKYK